MFAQCVASSRAAAATVSFRFHSDSGNVVRYSLFVAAEYEIYRLVPGDVPGNISFRFIEPRVPNPGGSCSREQDQSGRTFILAPVKVSRYIV